MTPTPNSYCGLLRSCNNNYTKACTYMYIFKKQIKWWKYFSISSLSDPFQKWIQQDRHLSTKSMPNEQQNKQKVIQEFLVMKQNFWWIKKPKKRKNKQEKEKIYVNEQKKNTNQIPFQLSCIVQTNYWSSIDCILNAWPHFINTSIKSKF